MMFWAVLGRNIVHHWKAFAFIGLALFAGIYILALKAEVRHQTKRADNAVEAKRLCAEGRKADRAAYARAQAEATRIATEAKRATEARYAAIQQEKDRALTLARADADARLRNWMRDKANQLARSVRRYRNPRSNCCCRSRRLPGWTVRSRTLHCRLRERGSVARVVELHLPNPLNNGD
jgi:hypothetical protein